MTSTDSDAPRLARLRKQIQSFPTKPGVYVMKDEGGEVIYIGKAKNLKARVRSYFGGGDGRTQIEYLLRRVFEIEFILTENESQALLLERDLIGKRKPRYNIRLKDDKAYLSVRLDENSKWPRLELVRKPKDDGARYFGPYVSSNELREVLEIIKRSIPLRSCSDTVFYNRQRPCLEYQIKRCCGPCCLPVERDEYDGYVGQAVSVLEGDTQGLVDTLNKKMEKASEDLRFEDAALFRDRIEVLSRIKDGAAYVAGGAEDRDIFALYREERLATLSIMIVRNGRIADSTNYAFDRVEVSDQAILEASIEQYYTQGREIPGEVVIPLELDEDSITAAEIRKKRGAAISFIVPKRGVKYRLLKLAQLNAKQFYVAKFDAESRYSDVATTLARVCKLSQMPRRIECVDISNLQGSDIVGALVTFFDGTPDKGNYRRYKISQQGKPDDFAAIREVVYRRLKRGIEEGDLPDLLVIDGGAGQLKMALEAREELRSEVDIISLAKIKTFGDVRSETSYKKPERIFIEGQSEAIELELGAELTNLMQRVRDEVHRFVITFHRSNRSKRVMMSVLDEVSGVGPERKKRLLKAFGSIENMKGASITEIARVARMSKLLAEKVLKKIN